MQHGLMWLGMDTYQAGEYGRKVGTVAGFVPGLGNAMDADDAKRSFGSGQYLLGGVQAIGAMIGIGPGKLVTKGLEKGAEKLVQKEAERAAIKAAEEKAAKEAAEAAAKKKAEEEAAKKARTAEEEGADGARNTRKPETSGRKITKEEYLNLRKKTPTNDLRKQVNRGQPEATPENPVKDDWLPGKERTGRLEADHIVSMKQITKMDGFGDLTEANQLKVLNNPDNFAGLSKSANTSKGEKSFSEWATYGSGANKIDVNPELRQEMIERSNELTPKLQNQIYDLLRSQE